MNSPIRLRAVFDDSPHLRVALTLLAALFICVMCLCKLGRWLGAATPLPAAATPVDVQIVELAPPPKPPMPPMPPMPPAPTLPAAPVANKVPLKQPAQAHPLPAPQRVMPAASRPKTLESAHTAEPAPPAPTAAQSQPVNEPAPRSTPPTDSAKPLAAASGDSAAHPLAQPLPTLPDDLREQAYQTVATARFLVHTDGSVEVDLIKPTPNPRLNQILLTALRQWRFFPAMQSGLPVESRLDIRVHFNVE